MKVNLNDRVYTFLIGYQKDNKYRAAFNNLAKNIFDLSFEEWYRSGYWNEKYIPYTLFDGDKAIANVSVNIMDFNVFGEQKRYIQIGTVMTDEEYRNNNLNRFLMENVLSEWNDKCDFIYLYANKSVLELYPKFGFNRVKEHAYYITVDKNIDRVNFEKLNMDMQASRDMLFDYAKNTRVFGSLSMKENADLVIVHRF